MDILHTSLFAAPVPRMFGVGFHNVGAEGVLRASNEAMIQKVQHYYGERCGHLPLNSEHIRALVDEASEDIGTQMAYLSALYGKEVRPVTLAELQREVAQFADAVPLVVPYVNVPEVETRMRNELGAKTWGLPGAMTNVLKNKANFYQFASEIDLDKFCPPDYTIAPIFDVAQAAERFLQKIEDIYATAGMAGAYPLGVMLRASEEDGNYGCCLLYEEAGRVLLIPDGDAENTLSYTGWREALADAQVRLAATMNVQKEMRVVISRYIDFVDSPGMSVVIMDDHVVSLGWNGQLQKPGSKACVGTSTYVPKNDYMRRMQEEYEERMAAVFEALLRKTAQNCNIDFATIRGVANLDIMIPGELEKRLQRARKQPEGNYLAECNARWTNYTDAIMVVLGANRKEQTIANMKEVIRAGIWTIDKHVLLEGVNPQRVRADIAERDATLKQEGTRIICRMAKNPMGLIYTGDIVRAQREMDEITKVACEKGNIYTPGC